MKTKVLTSIILVAMILTTILSGCGTTDTNKETATADQLISATEETKAPTEAETESPTEEETEAPTEKETEADKDKADDTNEDEDTENEQNSNSGSASNTSSNKNTSSGSSSASTTNKKPSSSSNSGSSSTTNKKPSTNSNSSSNSSSNSKPSNNSGSSSNSKPSSGSSNNTPQVITDDTPIPHNQLCTDANMQKVTSAVNNYFINMGSIYNPSLNKDNCGWFYSTTAYEKYSTRSVNEVISREIQSFYNESNALFNMYGATYSDMSFYCYAERRSDGEYDIYFCHE